LLKSSNQAHPQRPDCQGTQPEKGGPPGRAWQIAGLHHDDPRCQPRPASQAGYQLPSRIDAMLATTISKPALCGPGRDTAPRRAACASLLGAHPCGSRLLRTQQRCPCSARPRPGLRQRPVAPQTALRCLPARKPRSGWGALSGPGGRGLQRGQAGLRCSAWGKAPQPSSLLRLRLRSGGGFHPLVPGSPAGSNNHKKL